MVRKTKAVVVDDMDAALILAGLREGLRQAQDDLALLRLAETRDLTAAERAELPTALQGLPRAALSAEVDGWHSYAMHYAYLIEEFDPDRWP